MSSSTAGPSKTSKPKASRKKPSQKATEKGKKTVAESSTAAAASVARNEGVDASLDYTPPPGAALVNEVVDAEEFDYDALKGDENIELWIVRVPEAVKPRHLESLELDTPSSSVTSRIGSFEKKSINYDVWSLGNDESTAIGGEEIKNLTCLVPRKRKGGKLYVTPPSIATRHIVISARPSLPTLPQPTDVEGSSSESTVVYTNPPRPSYPVEALKHMFMPTGSLVLTPETSETGEAEQMEVDDVLAKEPAPARTQPVSEDKGESAKEKDTKKKKKEKVKKESADGSTVKSRKRKVDEESSPTKGSPTKKSKKVKA